MPASSTTVLDQIALFFIFLLSGASAYWFTINSSCDHASQLSTRLGIDVTINLAVGVMEGVMRAPHLLSGVLGRWCIK
jgi:hypothetical protein